MVCLLLQSSAVRVYDSHAYGKMDVTRERNRRISPVIRNWFQHCQYCCRLCYPGEYLRLGTIVRYNWTGVLEACDHLKLLSVHFDLVDAAGVLEPPNTKHFEKSSLPLDLPILPLFEDSVIDLDVVDDITVSDTPPLSQFEHHIVVFQPNLKRTAQTLKSISKLFCK